jgi:hypothetical protein
MASLQLSTLRSLDDWRYLLAWAEYPLRLVEDRHDQSAVGYICSRTLTNGRGIQVIESGITDYSTGIAVLHQLKTETSGDIQLGWPQTNILVQIGRNLGGSPIPGDQWLLRIHFASGRLRNVASIGFVDASMGADGGDLCIPPDAFVRLVLGYRDLDELQDAWPDIVVKPESRYLCHILFPKVNAYFCMPYLFYGQVLSGRSA